MHILLGVIALGVVNSELEQATREILEPADDEDDDEEGVVETLTEVVPLDYMCFSKDIVRHGLQCSMLEYLASTCLLRIACTKQSPMPERNTDVRMLMKLNTRNLCETLFLVTLHQPIQERQMQTVQFLYRRIL